MINGGTSIISSKVITDVLTDSSKMILRSDTFPLDSFKSHTLMIASQNEPTLSFDRIVRKHRKDDSSDPSSSDDFDSSDDSHYRRKRHKNKKHQEKDPIRLWAALTSKFLTTAYKSKIIRFKMDENSLQRRIYFLTFINSLHMIFHSTEKLVKFF